MKKNTIILLVFISFLLGLLCGLVTVKAADDELYLAASVVQSEAGNQSEVGQRLVADTIFNRVESVDFPNTVSDVILQRGQYTSRRLAPPPSVLKLVEEELYSRTNSEVLWFKRNGYHSYGRPLFQEGDHYFSGR